MFMERKFRSLNVVTQFDLQKFKLILKNNSPKCWLCFRVFFGGHKKAFNNNFAVPLNKEAWLSLFYLKKN